MIITFFGHKDFSDEDELKDTVLNILEDRIRGKDVQFYLGGYGNFDSFALNCCKEYKEKHKNAKTIFITPYINEWLNERKEYLESAYDEIIYPEIENTPLKFAISKRNEWMIEESDLIIAYVNRHYGGAYNALIHANRKKKEYINLVKDYELY